jgi:hypothetical protein
VNAIRGRTDARWLPSRHHFALFRLYAFIRLLGARPERREGLILIVDRDQTAFEHHGVSLWVFLMSTCYVATTLFRALPLAAAFALALPVAGLLIEVPFLSSGLILRQGARVNGIVFMLCLAGASLYVARQPTWARFVAWQFFAMVGLNAIAAVLVFLLRGPIARLERGVASES